MRISRGSVYYLPRPVREADLAIMRRAPERPITALLDRSRSRVIDRSGDGLSIVPAYSFPRRSCLDCEHLMIGQNLVPANDFVPDHRVQQAGEKAAKYAAASRSKATLRGINVTGRTSRPVRPRTIDNPRRNDR